MNKFMGFRAGVSSPQQTAAPAGWAESLVRSRADIEAGRVRPLDDAVTRLRQRIARMEAKAAEATKPLV